MLVQIALPMLLAASAIAKPHVGANKHVKKAVVTETAVSVVYETVFVTEGGNAAVATATPAAGSDDDAASSSVATPVALAWRTRSWQDRQRSSSSAESTTLSTRVVSSTTTVAGSTRTLTTSVSVVSSATPVSVVSSAASTSTSSRASSTSTRSSSSSSSSTASSSAASSSARASSTAAAAGSTASPDADYVRRVLLHHNIHRANHSAPDAVWSDSMYAIALAEANVCYYAHNTSGGGGGYGQNIAAGVPASNVQAVITDMFYNGEVNFYEGQYGLANPSFDNFGSWGHFSQVVWKASTNIACATVDCTAKGLGNVGANVSPHFTVCNYQSVGNMGGEYGANIGRPLGRATLTSSYNG